MITIALDSGGHLYEQLYRAVRARIERGELAVGEKLPSKRKLAAHLKISPLTVETAYSQLVAEGYLRALPKSGYFVESPGETLHPTLPPTLPDQPEKALEWLFDFRTNKVDTALFPFSTWAKLNRRILGERHEALLQATAPQGDEALRREIAKYLYSYRGMSVQPAQIVLGAGSEYLLCLLVQLLGRDKLYGVENPGYHKIAKIYRSNGAEVRPIPLDKQGLRVDELYRTGADFAHVTPSHHFPLGTVMPVSRRRELLAWSEKAPGRYILEDDYDSEFRFSGRPIPALQSLDHRGRVIYLNTFAKSLAPSLRIGYMVLPPKLLEEYRSRFAFYSCTVPSFEQYTLCEFMQGGWFERHISRMRGLYRSRQNAFLAALEQSALRGKYQALGQDAGLHLLLRLSNGMSEQALVQSAKAASVRVYGLSEFYAAPPVPESTVVVGYSSYPAERMEEAAALLARAWAGEAIDHSEFIMHNW